MFGFRRRLEVAFTAVLLLMASNLVIAQNACTVNCGDKCTREVLGVKYRDPLCYTACEGERAACPITGGATLPDFGAIPANLARTACGLPHGVVLQSINSVCGFAAVDAFGTQRIESAKAELVRYGLVRADEFQGVDIFFCDSIHGSGVVPDRDRVFLHTRNRTAGTTYLASLLAHEMEHVRQYRVDGTDNFKCTYSRQVGDCLVSNLNRGIANLLRDGYCQTGEQNNYERRAYDFEAMAQRVLSQPIPQASVRAQSTAQAKANVPSGPATAMFCQVGRAAPGYCRVLAKDEGEDCACRRDRVPPPAITGLTRAGGKTTLSPKGEAWD